MMTEHIKNLIDPYCKDIKDSQLREEYYESLNLFIEYLERTNITMINTSNVQQVVDNYAIYQQGMQLSPEEIKAHQIKLNSFITKYINIILL